MRYLRNALELIQIWHNLPLGVDELIRFWWSKVKVTVTSHTRFCLEGIQNTFLP
uniref:Uncharacterized protein n=1 Tax=Anguilla anguilla TaxID=7936 RepID=A0A0E9T9K9_ANGAN